MHHIVQRWFPSHNADSPLWPPTWSAASDRAIPLHSPSRSVAPPVLNHLSVALVTRSKGEQLDSVGPGLERSDDPRGNAERIERLYLDDLIVELDATGAPKYDVDLLCLLMPVRESLALVGLQTVVADAGVLGLEILIGEPSLLDFAEPEPGGGVLDIGEFLERV